MSTNRLARAPHFRNISFSLWRGEIVGIDALARTLFGKDVAEHPGLERALDLTLQLMIGAAMSAVLHKEERRLDDLIDDWQVPQATSRPDLIVATAHLIADQNDGPVEVRADAWVSLNGRPRQRWIDPDVDLAGLSRTAPASSGNAAARRPSRTMRATTASASSFRLR